MTAVTGGMTAHRISQRLRVPAQSLAGPRPEVTVVIPCFNYGRFLADAVSSALTQRSVEVSVIVVDDASTDDSFKVAEALCNSDSRIEVIQHDFNQGPVCTFNDGLKLVTSDFLVRLDADDMLTPGALARAVAVARAFPSVGLVYGRPIHFRERPPRPRTSPKRWTVWPGLTWLENRCRSGVNVITSPEVLMRKAVVDVIGGQRELSHTHDMEMWFRMAAHADVAYIHGADQAWHREHAKSLSLAAISPGGICMLCQRRDAFELLTADDFPRAQEFRALAMDALSAEALARASYEIDRRRNAAPIIESLVSFAEETSPRAHELSEWNALRRRIVAGPAWTRRRPWLRLKPLVRIANKFSQDRRWRSGGTYDGH